METTTDDGKPRVVDVSSPSTATGPWAKWSVAPQSVETPQSAEEVALQLSRAAKTGTKILPVGEGSSLAFLGLPLPVDLALKLDHVSGIVDFTPGDLTICVRAGTKVKAVNEVVVAEGLWLPGAGDVPGTIGGLVACGTTGASGGELNGSIRERILGMQVASMDGNLTRSGGRVVKNVAGYDLHRMHPGTGGALGVVTEITFRLEPQPESRLEILVEIDGLQAARGVWSWLRTKGPEVAALRVELAGGGGLAIRALVIGDREAVAASAEDLEREWSTWGRTRQTEPSLPDWDSPPWQDPSRELSITLKLFPRQVLDAFQEVADLVTEYGLATDMCAYPNLGEIRLNLRGEPVPLGQLWDLLAEGARKKEWFYRVENEPPGLAIRRPGWSGTPALFHTLARIKHAYDPAGLLRPGSYTIDSLNKAAVFFAELEETFA